MALSVGIIGLPNVGKSTLFNALTRSRVAKVGNFPFTTIEPHVGAIAVPDDRLVKLGEIVQPEKLTPASIEFVDIAGLVEGASRGEGLGNQFLSHIRVVNVLAHVVREFEDSNVAHPPGIIALRRDREIVEAELLLADLAVAEKAMEGCRDVAKTGNENARARFNVLQRIVGALREGVLVSGLPRSDDERAHVRDIELMTDKPVLYVVNVSEKDLRAHPDNLKRELGVRAGASVLPLSVKLEQELSELADADQLSFLRELGLEESGLRRFVREAYHLLGLITFFTVVGGQECRAWALRAGETALSAAGKVHTDFQEGFTGSEVISFEDLVRVGGEAAAREAGKLRREGRGYVVQDGDVIRFLHR
jgi:GTP-binding protein YchF